MADRRPLTDGLKAVTSPVDPASRRASCTGRNRRRHRMTQPLRRPRRATRVPVSTKLRIDFARALKQASLQRQLSEQEPHTVQDILEQALEPWLRDNGYLK